MKTSANITVILVLSALRRKHLFTVSSLIYINMWHSLSNIHAFCRFSTPGINFKAKPFLLKGH